MSDGAHMGVNAERALKTILGGEDQPTEDEMKTPAQMLGEIREVDIAGPFDYGTAALAMAKIILEAYEAYPQIREVVPTEAVYLCGADGRMVWLNDRAVVLQQGLCDVLKQLHPDEASPQRQLMSGLTGFMWGWAVNAVGYALGEPPKPNPAIIEIGT